MVVMEYLEPNAYEHVTRTDRVLRAEVLGAVQQLHACGFVHGDLRNCNMMKAKDRANPKGVLLLDFDWAGKAGEVLYPGDINCATVRRPPGVTGCEPIEKEHDLAIIDLVFD